MSGEMIKRNALGHKEKVGKLYNAIYEEFQPQSLFGDVVVKRNLEIISPEKLFSVTVKGKGLFDRFELLNIEDELKISILTRMINPPNLSEFLFPEYNIFQERRAVVICRIHTKQEMLKREMITYAMKEKLYNVEDATHFVYAIDYGLTFAIELKVKTNNNVTDEIISNSIEQLKTEIELLDKCFLKELNLIKNNHNLQTTLPHNQQGVTNQQEFFGSRNIEVQIDQEESKETLSKHDGLRSRHESFEVVDEVDLETPIDTALIGTNHTVAIKEPFSVPQSEEDESDNDEKSPANYNITLQEENVTSITGKGEKVNRVEPEKITNKENSGENNDSKEIEDSTKTKASVIPIEFHVFTDKREKRICYSIEETMAYFQSLAHLAIRQRQNQAVPICYYMQQLQGRPYIPLLPDVRADIQTIYNLIENNKHIIYSSLEEAASHPCVVEFNGDIYTYTVDQKDTLFIVGQQAIGKLQMHQDSIQEKKDGSIKNSIRFMRRNGPKVDTVKKIEKFKNKTSHLSHCIKDEIRIILIINEWISKGVPYIGKYGDLQILNKKNSPFFSCYIFFCSLQNQRSKVEDTKIFNLHMALFNSLVRSEQRKCIFVDIDANPSLGQGYNNQTKIFMFDKQHYISTDLLNDVQNENFAILSEPETEFEKPEKEVLLSYSCPKAIEINNCIDWEHNWKCSKCLTLLKIGYAGYLYCNCGQVPPKTILFKCGDPSHGSEHYPPDEDKFMEYIDETQPRKKLVILVLGETGVGKSTWINALANYMTFDSLEEAEKSQPICLIHCKFYMRDENYQKRTIDIKPHANSFSDSNATSNEVLGDGKSSTQDPRTYLFNWKHYEVNIIDTPGIGDVSGIDCDKRNAQKILQAVSVHDEIHGICFLLKSNESRLTYNFRYCISELLLQLHRSAIHNIAFFFTNARGTFYKPGDTMEPLEAFINQLQQNRNLEIPLNRKTIYCVDNEAFRFLFAYKDGVKFSEDDHKNFGVSWEHSGRETIRFLDHIRGIKGHDVDMTLTLNNARSIILKLTRPLAKISELIQTNIKSLNDRKREVEKCEEELSKLAEKRMISTFGFQNSTLDYPRTVCTGKECTTLEKIPNSDQTAIVYTKICHSHCYLDDIELLAYPQPGLKNCAALNATLGEKCNECGCNWEKHLHINFEQRKVNFQIEDPNVRLAIDTNEDAKVTKQKMIKECEKRVELYEWEQKKTTECSVKFGGFLAHNAILPYNDSFEEYVKKNIEEEERCAAESRDYEKLTVLRKQLQEYVEERNILKQAMETDQNQQISANDVAILQQDLFNLPLSGNEIKQLFQQMDDYVQTQYHHLVVRVPTKTSKGLKYYKEKSKNYAKKKVKKIKELWDTLDIIGPTNSSDEQGHVAMLDLYVGLTWY